MRVAHAARTGESSWSNSDIAWASPTGDLVAVFAGIGPQGLGSTLAHRVAAALAAPPTASARERATWAIREAHAVALAYREHASGVVGSMASLACDGDDAFVAHVGDCRVYRLRPRWGQIECLTREDVAGDTEPLNRMLTHAVGYGEDVCIHESQVACAPGDVIVCCTSRVWRILGDEQLLAMVTREDAPAAIVQRVAELDPRGGSAVAIVGRIVDPQRGLRQPAVEQRPAAGARGWPCVRLGAREEALDDVRRAYDRWAQTYDRDPNRTRDLDAAALRAEGLIRPGDDVVEIGCGTGKNSEWLAGRCRSLVGLDLSPGMLEVARARVPAATFAEADITRPWPLPDASADVVLADLVLEHVADLAPVFAEARRVLRPGGSMWVSELHPYRQWAGGRAHFEREGERVDVPAFVHDTAAFVGAALDHAFDVVGLAEPRDAEEGPPRLLTMRLRAGDGLRPIRPGDDVAIAAIIRRVMTEHGASGPGFAIHDPEVDAISAAYARPGAGYFVVERDGQVVGGGGFAPLDGGPEGTCELRKMYFLPEVRGLGLGARMLERCLRGAKAAGHRRMYLETLVTMGRARALYEANGFQRLPAPIGATGHFGCDAWYMREL